MLGATPHWWSEIRYIRALAATWLAFSLCISVEAQASANWPLVRAGDSGLNVSTIQRLLVHRGYSVIPDGVLGDDTDSAIRSFQERSGLSVDGIVGQDTWRQLVVTLRRGERGSSGVEALQEQLSKRYGYAIAVDGDFGPSTHAAVLDFQAMLGLQVDGTVGRDTWQALLSSETVELFAEYEPKATRPKPACQQVAPWVDLVRFYPRVEAFNILGQHGFLLQGIAEARGQRINLDYYEVRVEVLPHLGNGETTPEVLLGHIRQNWNDYYDRDTANFSPYFPSDTGFAKTDPFGAVLHIDMLMGFGFLGLDNPDDGTVIVSDSTRMNWRFSTIWTPHDGYHPVSGTREFGVVPNDDGTYSIYTKGADRPTTFIDDQLSSVIFTKADQLWRSFQAKIADFINQNGGSAEVKVPIFLQYVWEEVETCFR